MRVPSAPTSRSCALCCEFAEAKRMTSAAAADLSIRPVFRAQTNCSGALLADTPFGRYTLELDPHFYGITISTYPRSPSAPPPCARASGRLRHWLVGLAVPVGHASGFFFSRRPAWQESSQHGSSFFPSRSPSTLHRVSQVPKIVIALLCALVRQRGADRAVRPPGLVITLPQPLEAVS